MGRGHKLGLLTALACLALGLAAVPAQATFHIMQIREVFFGTAPDHNDAYVELQMWAPGQNFVGGHAIQFSNDSGTSGGTALPADVANGQNQATILIGDTAVAARDETVEMSQDFNTTINHGGSVCWASIDCMSWGVGPLAQPPSPAGTPEPIPAEGLALQRSIAPGCPTALDGQDDSNDSATDFLPVTPNPRNNSSPITETLCLPGAGGDNIAPNTKIKKRPKNRTDDRTPTYKFKSTEAGSKFKCKVDKRRYRKCKSPKTLRGLDPGLHTFKVKATDKAGNTDRSPAKDTFRLIRG
jgi:hypothetical protein